MFAGIMGLALTAVLILGATLAATIGPTTLRYVFWIGLGILASVFVQFGIWVVIGADRGADARQLRRQGRPGDAERPACER